MFSASVTLEGFSELRAYVGQVQERTTRLRPVLDQIVDHWRTSVIPSQAGRQAPRSAVSEMLRPGASVADFVSRLRSGSGDTGGSVSVALPGGGFLLRGGTTAAGSMIAGKVVPARDFLSVPDSEVEAAAERIASYVVGE